MKIIKIDFETRATVPLRGKESVGLFNYWTHPDTQILMMAYKIDDGLVQLWQPHLGAMPKETYAALTNPKILVEAFNSAYERYGLEHKLNIVVPAERFLDPQVGGRYLSLPADLETVRS